MTRFITMVKFKIKKVGNHWYPCIDHDYESDISLDKKIEKVLDKYSYLFGGMEEFTIELEEIPLIMEDLNLIYFDESDITRFYTTNDDFDLRFEINNHEFKISAYLFSCLENQFHINLHETLYKLHIW